MARAKFAPILTATTGLNNTVDAVRLAYDFKTGVTELSQAVNVDVDDTGRISRRLGRTQKRSEASRCGFAAGETCLFVSGTDLYRLNTDYSRTLLRSGLTEGRRMSYWPVAGRIYYANGVEKGYVEKGVDRAWEKGTYQVPYETNRAYYDPPNGHLVAWFAGRMLVARENAVFASEPSFYGAFDLKGTFKLEAERITMLRPVDGGLWFGTRAKTVFYAGRKWEELRREPKYDVGVLEGSDTYCPGAKLGRPDRPVVFTTPQGICAGGEDGGLANLTYEKLTFPSAHFASGTVAGGRYIVLIQP